MAKLKPKDPQFGIPIAARVKESIAQTLKAKALENKISFSRQLALCLEQYTQALEKAADHQNQINRLHQQIEKERRLHKKTITRFLIEITKNQKESLNPYIETYNKLLSEEKQKQE